jgi:hypothetical protein
MGGVFCFARDQMISYVQKKPRVRRIIGCHHSRVDDMVPKLIACLSSKGPPGRGEATKTDTDHCVSTAFIEEPSLQSCERW